MSITHKVHVNEWRDGKLYTHEQYFMSWDSAMAFVNSNTAVSIKVYDAHSNELVHSKDLSQQDSYAGGDSYA
jgi:hypothetical protein